MQSAEASDDQYGEAPPPTAPPVAPAAADAMGLRSVAPPTPYVQHAPQTAKDLQYPLKGGPKTQRLADGTLVSEDDYPYPYADGARAAPIKPPSPPVASSGGDFSGTAKLIEYARQKADEYGVPADMFIHQLMGESSFDPSARNNVGAGHTGIGQFDPQTAQLYQIDPKNPLQSIDGAARYMRDLHEKTGTWSGALAAYAGAKTPDGMQRLMANGGYRTAFALAGTTLGDATKNLPLPMRAALDAYTTASRGEREVIERDAASLREQAMAAAPGSAQRAKLVDQMREKIAAREKDWQEKWANPPVMKPADMFEKFGSAATILSLFVGLFARNHLTAALTAAGAAMKGINQNNYDEFQRNMKVWDMQTKSALEEIHMQRQDLESIINDDTRAWDHKMASLGIMAQSYGLDRAAAGLRVGDASELLRTVTTMETGGKQLQAAQLAGAVTQRQIYIAKQTQDWFSQNKDAAARGEQPPIELQGEWYRNSLQMFPDPTKSGAPTTAKGREEALQKAVDADVAKFKADHPDATQGDVDDHAYKARLAHEKEMSTATRSPRSAPAMYMQQYMTEHPEATASEMSVAAAEFRRMQSVETGFASGILGRQLLSLNTVADHLLLVREYADALNNGQIPRANAVANRIATELGKPEITSFEAGRDIMADEVVRLLTTTGGTEADRQGMQSRLSSAMSPAQLGGALKVFERFTEGRFNALEQQYAQNDPVRRERFEKELLTPEARKVFRGGGGDAAKPSDSRLPPGIPAGSKQIGTKDGNPVYQAPDGSKYMVH